MKKIIAKPKSNAAKPVRSIETTERGKKNLSISEIEEPGKVRTLRQEIKYLELLHTLLIQWGYANYLLIIAMQNQEEEAEAQIYDRCKQLIELKKLTFALTSESNARNKNKMLDDVLSMEYSSLKNVEEDILITSSYLAELEENCYSFLNRLDLEKGVVISPQDLAEYLEKTAHILKKISSLIEDESSEILAISKEFQCLVDISKEQEQVYQEIYQLECEISKYQAQEKIKKAECILDTREKIIKSIILEELV